MSNHKNSNNVLATVSLFAWIAFGFLAGCSSGEETKLGERQSEPFVKHETGSMPTQDPPASKPQQALCPTTFPDLDLASNTCYWDDKDPRYCQFNKDCATYPHADTLPFCNNGVCSNKPASMTSCPSEYPHFAFGECYNALTNALNCGGSGKGCETAPGTTCSNSSCDDGTYCHEGFCVSGNDTACAINNCPVVTPHCQQGGCYNFWLDQNNCGKANNKCPPSKPYCKWGDCSTDNPNTDEMEK